MVGVLDTPLAQVEEIRGLNKMLREEMTLDVSTAEAVRKAREGPASSAFAVETVEEAVDRRIPGPAGGVRARVIVPRDVRAVYLQLHGGGWAIGTPESDDVGNLEIANEARVAVVSVDYRLAPEAPHPGGPDDCEAAAVWLIERAREEFGTERLLIGGQSAGAHLAALTLLRVRDRHDAIDRFAGANLVYGVYDLSLTPSARAAGGSLPVLSTANMRDFADHYLPGVSLERRRASEYSPLYADLTGMPPALFTVGSLDLLLDDTLFMASRWRSAGNECELDVHPDAPHGFTRFPVEIARTANSRAREFLARRAKG